MAYFVLDLYIDNTARQTRAQDTHPSGVPWRKRAATRTDDGPACEARQPHGQPRGEHPKKRRVRRTREAQCRRELGCSRSHAQQNVMHLCRMRAKSPETTPSRRRRAHRLPPPLKYRLSVSTSVSTSRLLSGLLSLLIYCCTFLLLLIPAGLRLQQTQPRKSRRLLPRRLPSIAKRLH